MSKRTAKIVLFVVFAGILVAVWVGRGRPGPVDRLQHESLTVFLASFALLSFAIPPSMWMSERAFLRRRGWYAVLVAWPLAGGFAWATVAWFRASNARLVPTLIIGAAWTVALGGMVLLDWWRKRHR